MVQAVQTPETSSFADGVTATFPTIWSFEAETEVVVSVEIGTAAPVVKTPGVDYDVLPGDWLTYGSSIQFRAGSIPPNGARVIRRRRTTADQPVGYGDLATFRPRQSEGSFDKLTRQSQEHGARLDRAVKVPVGDSAPTVPRAAQRAGRLAIFDAEGDFDPDAPTLEALANPVASATAAAAAAAASAASAQAAAGAVGEDRTATLTARDEAVQAALAVSGAVENVNAAKDAGVAAVTAQANADKTAASAAIAADRDSALTAISADKSATLTAKTDAVAAKVAAEAAKTAAEAAAASVSSVSGSWAATITGALPDPVSQALFALQAAWTTQPTPHQLAIYEELLAAMIADGTFGQMDLAWPLFGHSLQAQETSLVAPGAATQAAAFGTLTRTPFVGIKGADDPAVVSAFGRAAMTPRKGVLNSSCLGVLVDQAPTLANGYLLYAGPSRLWNDADITRLLARVTGSATGTVGVVGAVTNDAFLVADRPDGSNIKVFKNGALIGSSAVHTATGVDSQFLLFATNSGAASGRSNGRAKFAFHSAHLTDAQVASLNASVRKAAAAMAAYA